MQSQLTKIRIIQWVLDGLVDLDFDLVRVVWLDNSSGFGWFG